MTDSVSHHPNLLHPLVHLLSSDTRRQPSDSEKHAKSSIILKIFCNSFGTFNNFVYLCTRNAWSSLCFQST